MCLRADTVALAVDGLLKIAAVVLVLIVDVGIGLDDFDSEMAKVDVVTSFLVHYSSC
jgi:hypothetical protein